MGCYSSKHKAELKINKMDSQLSTLLMRNQDLTQQLGVIQKQEDQIAQVCEQPNERKKIDLTALASELEDKFKEISNTITVLDRVNEQRKLDKQKELVDWKNIFDKIDLQSKGNLSCIQEEDEK